MFRSCCVSVPLVYSLTNECAQRACCLPANIIGLSSSPSVFFDWDESQPGLNEIIHCKYYTQILGNSSGYVRSTMLFRLKCFQPPAAQIPSQRAVKAQRQAHEWGEVAGWLVDNEYRLAYMTRNFHQLFDFFFGNLPDSITRYYLPPHRVWIFDGRMKRIS